MQVSRLLGVVTGVVLATSATAENILPGYIGGQLLASPPPGIGVNVRDGKVDLSFDGGNRKLVFKIPIPRDWAALRMSMRMSTRDVAVGRDPAWQYARMQMLFTDDAGKRMGDWPVMFGATGTTNMNCAYEYAIPPGTTFLDLQPGNHGVSGSVTFENVVFEPVPRVYRQAMLEDAPPPVADTPGRLFSLDDAWRLTTPNRERVCLNGLWQFRPVLPDEDPSRLPPDRTGWGYYKVPGSWGRSQDYILSPAMKAAMTNLNSAWYRRTLTFPAAWQGRRLALSADLIQSCAKVYVDGQDAGDFYFPGGELDITRFAKPGQPQTLAILVSAKAEDNRLFMAPGRLIGGSPTMENRGIAGDLYVDACSPTAAVSDVHMITAVSRKEITFDTGFAGPVPPGTYRLRARVFEGDLARYRTGKAPLVREFDSGPFDAQRIKDGRFAWTQPWADPKLWDTDTPGNMYTACITLGDADGRAIDDFLPQDFGFREIAIAGRNLMLNGTPLHLRAVVADTCVNAALASDAQVALLVDRARAMGANFAIGHNYNINPGTLCYYDAFHRVTSRMGFLTSCSLPHAGDFGWKLHEKARHDNYSRIAEQVIRRVQNIPGMILYVADHNALGFAANKDPAKIGMGFRPERRPDGTLDKSNYRYQGEINESIARRLDPSRPMYHHESGSMAQMFTINCYLNWAPRQERDDWLETWEQQGVQPVMFVEWGVPHVASWSSYRGPDFIWSARPVQCLWLNEYNAAILGEEAYRQAPVKVSLAQAHEANVKGNRGVHFGSLCGFIASSDDGRRVREYMLERNIPAMRARGISGLLPWDFDSFQRETGKGTRQPNPNAYRNLKQPGLVPDYLPGTGAYLYNPGATFEIPPDGRMLQRYFGDAVGFLAGRPGDFTEHGHAFAPGETVEKSLVMVNDSRRPAEVRWSWSVLGSHLSGQGTATIGAGERTEVPIAFKIPDHAAGRLALASSIAFPNGTRFDDTLDISIVPRRTARLGGVAVGLHDPEGTTRSLLDKLGIAAKPVAADGDLEGIGLLVIGRNALTSLPFAVSARVNAGLKLLLMEQGAATLNRLGLRAQEYGLREAFANDAAFAGEDRDLSDWRGRSTLLPPFLRASSGNTWAAPSYEWEGFKCDRVWRCGNRGTVCSVMPEKPCIGDWLPLYQGGFDLQYAPLMEFREGQAIVMLSQLDLAGRTEDDPRGLDLLARALERLAAAAPRPALPVIYAGSKDGAALLDALRVAYTAYAGGPVPSKAILVLGTGATVVPEFAAALRDGARLLALGLDTASLRQAIPEGLPELTPAAQAPNRKWYADRAAGLGAGLFAGVSSADANWREGMVFDAFPSNSVGGLALQHVACGKGEAVICQLPPWAFDAREFYNRTTVRRSTFLVARLLGNLGAGFRSGFVAGLDASKAGASGPAPRFYADTPDKGDNPYRYYAW